MARLKEKLSKIKDTHNHTEVNTRYAKESEKLREARVRAEGQVREFRQRILNFRNETTNSQAIIH